MERKLERLRRTVENLRPENRLAVVADLEISGDMPWHTRVLLDRGERKVDVHGVYREFSEIIVPTRQAVQEEWAVLDLVHIGRLGAVTRIASFQELKDRGADVDEIYARFMNWIAIKEEAEARREGEQARDRLQSELMSEEDSPAEKAH
jgi:hypothetical protein